jgi:DNA-directed RNA polymerase subunit RPC12/RpoP
MGRTSLKGLDYFPIDTTWETNVKLVKAKFGTLEGAGFLAELWASIYRENYYRDWTEETELLFADEIKRDVAWVHEVVEYCFEKKIFDRAIYDRKKVLTSHGIQKRYFKIARDSLKRTGLDYIDGVTYPDFMPKNNLGGKADNPGGYTDNPGGKAENQGGYDDKQSKANLNELNLNKAASAAEARPLDLVDNLGEELRNGGLVFSEADLQALALRCVTRGLDAGFVSYAIDRAGKTPKTKNPKGLAKRGLLEYDNWAEEYAASSKPTDEHGLAPLPGPCSCGGLIKAQINIGQGVCSSCGDFWEYDFKAKAWRKTKPEPAVSWNCPDCKTSLDVDHSDPVQPRASCPSCGGRWLLDHDWGEWVRDPEPAEAIRGTG